MRRLPIVFNWRATGKSQTVEATLAHEDSIAVSIRIPKNDCYDRLSMEMRAHYEREAERLLTVVVLQERGELGRCCG